MTRSADLVTVERSTLSKLTCKTGGLSNVDRKPAGLSRPISFKVASNVMAMRRS
jgi:hypothetical protein